MNKPPAKPPQQAIQVTTRQLTGPLPPPEILAQYNQVSPGAADRIIAMAEDNNRHFQTMDKMTVSSTYQERRTGQWCGLIIGLAVMGVCAFGFYLGHATEAAWLGGTTIVGLVSVFVVGRIHKQPSQK